MNGVRVTALGTGGPRVLLLPGLGARGAGFRRLAELLAPAARPILVEYPEGRRAFAGASALAEEVLLAVGPVDAVVASSFGGMVAGHLASRGGTRGVAFVGSFTNLDQLGVRGRLFRLMGPIAEIGRPGPGAAMIAANRFVPLREVADVVPTTALERRSVLLRAFAIPREPPPQPMSELSVSCIAIHGEQDWLLPVDVLPRLAATLPPGSPTHVIAGAGHVPYFTHPSTLADILRPWLAELGERVPRVEAA